MTDFESLMLRVQARRVAVSAQMAERPIPDGAARILAGDTIAQINADNAAFKEWCKAHGVECVAFHEEGLRFDYADGSPAIFVPIKFVPPAEPMVAQ